MSKKFLETEEPERRELMRRARIMRARVFSPFRILANFKRNAIIQAIQKLTLNFGLEDTEAINGLIDSNHECAAAFQDE